ncbi:MAG: alcohol dehydrogenase catalytic domain-containing protein [Chloroflexota bacterium]|nr:alcohol dehydrogenase catalytic domain-containing protein [Chloroflexota bacterium]
MRALHFDKTLSLRTDYPPPTRPKSESLVRILKSGICNTDLELTRGYMGFQGVLGHEFVGVVEESDDPTLVGQRVVGEINAYCGECETCRIGNPTHCPHRTTLGIDRRDGTHTDYTILPTRNLLRVPENVTDDEALFTEPLAAACEILQQIQIRPTDRVVVIGDGKLGLLVAQVLALTGCDLHAIGRHEAKLEILARRSISTEVVPRDGESILPDNSTDIVVECAGNPTAFDSARRLVHPRGTIILKSTYAGNVEVNLSTLVVDEIQLLGSRCGPFAPALRLLEASLVDVTSLIHARYSLDEGLAAFEHATRKGTLKVVLEME